MNTNTQSGNIQLIFGPMFSGKTTELLRRIRRFTVAKRKCLVLKYLNDNRFGNGKMASTHDKTAWNAVPCALLEDVKQIASNYDVIGIDEGQFFPDVVTFSEDMANLGKTVIVAALDGTFQRKPFGTILELVPLAESVTKLNAVCVICQGDASFSKRLGKETQIELIGGEDKYIAVCRQCYHSSSTPDPANSDEQRLNFLCVSPIKKATTSPLPSIQQNIPSPIQSRLFSPTTNSCHVIV